MARTKIVLTVLLFFLFIPMSFAQSASGAIGLEVISGSLVGAEKDFQETVASAESNSTSDEIEVRHYGEGMAAMTGDAVLDEDLNCLKILVPILAIVIIIAVIGHILYTRKKKK